MAELTLESLWKRLLRLHEFNKQLTDSKADKCDNCWIKIAIDKDDSLNMIRRHMVCNKFIGRLFHRDFTIDEVLKSIDEDLAYNEQIAIEKHGYKLEDDEDDKSKPLEV